MRENRTCLLFWGLDGVREKRIKREHLGESNGIQARSQVFVAVRREFELGVRAFSLVECQSRCFSIS